MTLSPPTGGDGNTYLQNAHPVWSSDEVILRWTPAVNIVGFAFRVLPASPSGLTGYQIKSAYGSTNVWGRLSPGSYFPAGTPIVSRINLYDLKEASPQVGETSLAILVADLAGNWSQFITFDLFIPTAVLPTDQLEGSGGLM